MQLSDRLQAVASMVTENSRLADVGTDHGYIPIYLCEMGKIPSAIAMDVKKGPLLRAKMNIERYHMQEKIRTRLSDGVLKLNPDEADSVVIAGMGGTLVMKILEEGKKVLVDVKELVLQPQSDIDKVRKYLYENDYVITAEKMVCEEEKYYPMMHVQHGHMEELADIEWKYGAFLLKEKNPVLGSFLKKEETTLTGVLQNLRQQPKERVKERILEIEALLALNRKAQKWLLTVPSPRCHNWYALHNKRCHALSVPAHAVRKNHRHLFFSVHASASDDASAADLLLHRWHGGSLLRSHPVRYKCS